MLETTKPETLTYKTPKSQQLRATDCPRSFESFNMRLVGREWKSELCTCMYTGNGDYYDGGGDDEG